MGSYRTNKVWQSNRQPDEARERAQRRWNEMLDRQAKMIEARDRLATLYGPSEDHEAAWEAFWATISDSATMSEITAACEKQYITRRAELDTQARDEQMAREAELREWMLNIEYDEIPY